MIMHHPVHMQIFDTNHTETVDDLAAFLMCEVIAPEGDTFMDSGDYPAVLPTLRCALGQFRVFALDFGKCLLFLAKKARVRYLFFITESSKGLETDINTHLGRRWLKTFRLTLDREGNIPFAGTTTADSAGFQFALDRSMVDHLDRANLGESHTVMGDTETTLRKGEGVVAVSTTETRVARVRSCFTASKKGFEGQINTYCNILQDLRMDLFQCSTFLFQQSQRINLMIAGERLSLLLISCFPLLKKMVVEPTTFTKSFVQLLNLLLGWVDAILKHFMHSLVLAQSRTYVNRFLRLRAARLISPWLKPGVLRRGLK